MEAEAFKNKKMLLITTETPRNAGLNSLSFFKILSLLATLPGVYAKPTVPIEIYSLSVFANYLKIFLGKKKKNQDTRFLTASFFHM